MAEVLAILGGVGSIVSIVDGISKVVGIIRELQARWGEADLALLSLASQLTALRAATTKIQDWIDQDLQDTHHQLVMDLDVSISCCKLLMDKIESFFTNMAQLTEKPLDLCDKFKAVFGSSGPESVQRLIEHQTSALTLLLTACNCKTLSAQQRYLKTSKTRKVLHRAKADSVSLYVHRDSASLTSKMTDNLSKISRVFEFDSNIFSTGIYERAFRGSVRDLLRRQQQTMMPQSSTAPKTESVSTSNGLRRIRILGQDQISKESLVNEIESAPQITREQFCLYQWKFQKLCLNLVSTIVRNCSDVCDDEYVRILTSYAVLDPCFRVLSMHRDVLECCVMILRKAVEQNDELDPVPLNCQSYRIEFENMVFWVRSVPDRGLSIKSGNCAARFFIHSVLRILSTTNLSSPLRDLQEPADLLRAEMIAKSSLKTALCQNVNSEVTFGPIDLVRIVDAQSHYHGEETIFVFVFDLQDYSIASPPFEELKGRAERNALLLADSIVFPQCPVVALVFSNFGNFEKQVKTLGFPLEGEQPFFDANVAIEHIKMSLNSQLKAQGWGYTVALNDNKDMDPIETLVRLREFIIGMKRCSVAAKNTSRPESQIRLSSKNVESIGVAF